MPKASKLVERIHSRIGSFPQNPTSVAQTQKEKTPLRWPSLIRGLLDPARGRRATTTLLTRQRDEHESKVRASCGPHSASLSVTDGCAHRYKKTTTRFFFSLSLSFLRDLKNLEFTNCELKNHDLP